MPGWKAPSGMSKRSAAEAIVVPTDVASPDQVEQAADAVEKQFGPIDIWVNNAFCSVFSPAKQMTAADYRRVTEVTYLGFVHGTLRGTPADAAARPRHDRSGRLGV